MRRIILATLLFCAANVAGAATLRETFDRTYDVRTGATVGLSNVNGSITITSWDQPRVRVHAEKIVERGDADEARKIMSQMRIEIEPVAGGLSIRTRHPQDNGSSGILDLLFGGGIRNSSVRYEVTVPRNMRLDLDDTNGAVVVNGVNGMLKVETTNGRIELNQCGGALDLETTNGSIHAQMLQLDRSKQHSVETTNGRIAVSLPGNAAVSVDASTTNGRVSSELPITTTSFDRNTLRGAINGGGASLRLRTTNGSIEINSVAGAAQASR